MAVSVHCPQGGLADENVDVKTRPQVRNPDGLEVMRFAVCSTDRGRGVCYGVLTLF